MFNPDAVPDSVIAEVADQAANEIEKHGLHKGDWNGPGQSCCVRGAIGRITDRLYPGAAPQKRGSVSHATERAMARLLGLPFPEVGSLEPNEETLHPLPKWNDAPARTPDEVIGALRDTATKHRDDAMVVTQ